jgi:hypothetical protein
MAVQDWFVLTLAQATQAQGLDDGGIYEIAPRAIDATFPGEGTNTNDQASGISVGAIIDLTGCHVAPKRIADDPACQIYAPSLYQFLQTLPVCSLDTDVIFYPYIPESSRTYDFVSRAYTADTAVVDEASAVAGTVRAFIDEFLSDNWGAKTDPAYNNLYNVDWSTAVTGTLGSGGLLPIGMSFVNMLGMSCDVTNMGTDEMKLHLYSNSATPGSLRLLLASPTAIPVSPNGQYTVAFECQQVGPITGLRIDAGVNVFLKGARFYTSAGVFVGPDSYPVGQTIHTDDQLSVPASYTYTIPSTASRIAPMFAVFMNPTGPVDLTVILRKTSATAGIGRMQYLGRGATASADNLSPANLTTIPDNFSLDLACRLPPDNNNGSLIELGSGNDRVEVLHSSYAVSVKVVNGGVSTSTSLGLALPWMRTKVALSVSNGFLTASLNGKPAVVCGGMVPSLSGVKPGNGTTGALRGSFESWNFRPIDVTALAVQAMATLPNAMYDDFDRADGPVGKAWTGQTYQQSGTAGSSLISGKRVVTVDSGLPTTSAYFLTDMGAIPKLVGGAMAWETPSSSGSAGLICTPNNTTQSFGSAVSGITAKSSHFLASPAGIFPGKFIDNNITDHQWNFSSAGFQIKDGSTYGSTVYKMRPSDGAIMCRVHNGEIAVFAGENYYSIAGQNVVHESYRSTNTSGFPIWVSWAAEI